MSPLRQFISVILTGILLFPISVSLAHTFQGHEHNFCNHYADSHFHETVEDCDIFHFHQAFFSLPDAFTETTAVVFPSVEETVEFPEIPFKPDLEFFLRRGPPQQ